MSDSSQQWRDSGSGPGHLQAVVPASQEQLDAAVNAAFNAFLAHAHDCTPCRVNGVDCETAADLRTGIREAKAAAK